mmetsp:Transcript_24415/g.56595  ORF Transcript_24415/g.56595 Transcript_24415/m.56595 type:complete len:344 (+) Transcript_24415:14-1045(+)
MEAGYSFRPYGAAAFQVFHCAGISAGLKHQCRLCWYAYALVMMPLYNMLFPQYFAMNWRFVLLLVAVLVVAWCMRDSLYSIALNVMESPGASLQLLQGLTWCILILDMFPRLILGRDEDHMNCLVLRGIGFYSVWMPLLDLDSSACLLVTFTVVCLLHLGRAVPSGLQFDHDLVRLEALHILEGVILRLMMFRLDRRGTLRARDANRDRENYMRHWVAPYAKRFGRKAWGWERCDILAESREGAATLAKVRRIALDWHTRQEAVQGFMCWAYYCLKSERLPAHVMHLVLEFLEFRDKKDQDECDTQVVSVFNNSVDSIPMSTETVSTAKFVRNRFARLLSAGV